MRLFFLLACLSYVLSSFCRGIVHDTAKGQLHQLLSDKGKRVIIRYHHTFEDTLFVADNCELLFEGGSLCGPIVFNNTKLRGSVNIVGSTIKGHIKNRTFDASWLCYKDGIHDDAQNINTIMKVCPKIFFPAGEYRLISEFRPDLDLKGEHYIKSVRAHIGIHKDNIELQGEAGTIFSTNEQLSIICIYSLPYKIDGSVKNIAIRNIEFETLNDGSVFLEWTHAIKLIGVNGIKIANCTINGFWGDAICLDHYGDTPSTGERTRNQNVSILNNKIYGGGNHNQRNGISVINGKNVLIKENIIKNTSRKDMPGGIDVEPNNSAYTIENIWIEKNVIENVLSNGIQLYIPKGGPANNVCLRYNTIKSCRCGLYIGIVSDNTTEKIRIIGNHIDADTRPYIFKGCAHSANWIVSNNVFERPCTQIIPGDIKIDKLVMKNNKKKD